MASSWSLIHPLAILLQEHPKTLLPIACSLFFFSLIFHKINRSRVVPANWPLVGMLPAIPANLHRIHDYITGILRRSGGTFVFRGPWASGMNYLITCDPANTNHVLNLHFANYPKGHGFSEIFDILGDGIFTSDGEWWKAQRRTGHALLTNQRFRSFVKKCCNDKVEDGLVPLLHQMAKRDVGFDMQDILMRFTFDTTCIMVSGVDPGCLSLDERSVIPLAKAIDDAEHVTTFRYTVPMVWWKLLRWLRVGEENKLAKAWETIDRSLTEIIEWKSEEMKGSIHGHHKEVGDDLLTSYMMLDGDSFRTTKFLRDTMLTVMSAGRTTTGAALAWFFWLVSKNPNVEAKILHELREAKINGTEIGKLGYLHASLCETLRLYPPVPFNHKAVLQPDVLPSGHKVDRGMTLLITSYPMGRMDSIWGKDCEEFRPERWISEDGKLRHEPSYKFLAFNSGPKTCLGKDMALTQMKAVAAAVIYNFHVDVMKEKDVEPAFSIVLTIKNGLMVKMRKRSVN